MSEKKPHILLLISDEHRPDILPVEGNPHVRTPYLDRLIESGVYFQHAYTPAPHCVPARHSFLSGLYPRRSGCLHGKDPMPSEVLTIPRHLARYGYQSVAAGKMHFVGTDQMHGWQERIGRDIRVRTDEPVHDSSHAAKRDREPGTGQWSLLGQPESKFVREIMNARAGEGPWMRQGRYSVDGALQFLDEYFVNESYDRTGDGPLFLCVSLNVPHYPYQCPEELFAHYLRRVKPIRECLPDGFNCAERFQVEIGRDVTYREAHRATAAYYGMIEWMDEQFGRVIRQLEAYDLLEDFIVVYLSDHGEMLGEKGLWEKQQYFESSVRVPFFVRLPGGEHGGRRVEANVSLVDLFPTLCDLVNVPVPDQLDGRSLLPLIEGSAEAWAYDVYSELWRAENGPSVMIKEGDLKYFRFDGKGWLDQLYDLARDPEERVNLTGDPAYQADLVRLRAKLDALPPPRRKDAANHFL